MNNQKIKLKKMSQKVIINVGVSGAGKSTWTEKYISQNPRTIRINRDDIRRTLRGTLIGYYKQDKLLNTLESMVNNIEEYMLVQALLGGFDVVIDNTNLKVGYINRWLVLLEKWDSQVDIFFKIFREDHAHSLKQRVNTRDAPESWKSLDYIDKQVEDLPKIIQHIERNYKNQILND